MAKATFYTNPGRDLESILGPFYSTLKEIPEKVYVTVYSNDVNHALVISF